MSFDIVTFLEDPPRLNGQNPAAFEEHYRDTIRHIRDWFNKQRDLGLGTGYDSSDRVEVPLWWTWMMT